MSRIGKKIIAFPEQGTVTTTDGVLVVKGPKGELKQQLHSAVTVTVDASHATVQVQDPTIKLHRSLWGTFASLLENMVEGVSKGFEKRLEIHGVGFQWQVSGSKVTLKAGYSHPVVYTLPDGVKAALDEGTLVISGIDKQCVGEVAAQIRHIRIPEPYKGKGIKYVDEHIQRKSGKQAAGAEA